MLPNLLYNLGLMKTIYVNPSDGWFIFEGKNFVDFIDFLLVTLVFIVVNDGYFYFFRPLLTSKDESSRRKTFLSWDFLAKLNHHTTFSYQHD